MRNKCYKLIYNRYIILTPVDITKVEVLGNHAFYRTYSNKHHSPLLGDPVQLRNPTLLDKIRLLPAISAAILARLVRKIKDEKGTELERDLMRFYYKSEVRIRGI